MIVVHPIGASRHLQLPVALLTDSVAFTALLSETIEILSRFSSRVCPVIGTEIVPVGTAVLIVQRASRLHYSRSIPAFAVSIDRWPLADGDIACGRRGERDGEVHILPPGYPPRPGSTAYGRRRRCGGQPGVYRALKIDERSKLPGISVRSDMISKNGSRTTRSKWRDAYYSSLSITKDICETKIACRRIDEAGVIRAVQIAKELLRAHRLSAPPSHSGRIVNLLDTRAQVVCICRDKAYCPVDLCTD